MGNKIEEFWDEYLNTTIDAMKDQDDVEKTKRLIVYNKSASNVLKKAFLQSSIRHFNSPNQITADIPEADVL